MTTVSRDQLAADLSRLGLDPGTTVLAHCSLSALGFVPGGEQTLALAIRDAIGSSGTLVVPAQSWQLCDPAYLRIEPEDQWTAIRESLPAYDPGWTPTRTMGRLADAIRTHPEAHRSGHPHRSFAAWGPAAASLMAGHQLDDPVGEGSPLSPLYSADSAVLLLGVGYEKCTALHLAESRSQSSPNRVSNGAPMSFGGERRWVEFEEPVVDDSDFVRIGAAFEDAVADGWAQSSVGDATAKLVRMRALVDFAADWMVANR